VSTSILFSAFEAWMVHEHHRLGFRREWIDSTFVICTGGNGVVAIVAGVVASFSVDKWGPVAPFDVSLIFLVIGTALIFFLWTENSGDARINLQQTVQNAVYSIRADRKVALVGLIQAFFEGSMYTFVFMWTPALESTSGGAAISHGWVFACFMLCVLLGSHYFGYRSEHGLNVEHTAIGMFAVAGATLFLAAFIRVHTLRLLLFFVFEVCVGMFWPTLGVLRTRYVPEEVRATVINIFRVPLNAIVIVILYNIGTMTETTVFLLCTFCLSVALCCQYYLCTLSGYGGASSSGGGHGVPPSPARTSSNNSGRVSGGAVDPNLQELEHMNPAISVHP